MRCLSPVKVARAAVKVGGSGDSIYVPCGRCLACLQKRRNEWSFRLQEEFKLCNSAHFVTLTYNEDNLPWGENPSLSKRDVQLFIKRLRKKIGSIKKEPMDLYKQFRYFICGEYGSKTSRPHYHGIFFNMPEKLTKVIHEIWNQGNVVIAECNVKTINYTTKYMLNSMVFGLAQRSHLV